jgi:hypothetical protein
MTDQPMRGPDHPMRGPDQRETPTRPEPRDPEQPARSDREGDRENPLLREGADAPDAADIEDPEHQR